MSKLIDLTGKKFGRLTVIRRSYPNKKGQPMWLCKCDCGTEKIISGNRLKVGDAKSCGCLRKEAPNNKKRLNLGLANMRSIMRGCKRKAKKQGLDYKLTEEQYRAITQKDCYYCGAKPNNISKNEGRYGVYIYNGIDRVDNNKGYTMDNIVPCCKRCNYAKKNHTLQEFKDWIKRIYDNINKKGDKNV